MSQDKEGWVYCISNENVRSAKIPNNVLLKIGMTDRTPQERLAEANRSDTWRPPVNYKIEFAKKVKNALQKEKTIHKLLEQYNERVNRSREFFDISVEKAHLYFDLMDGEYLEFKEEPKEEAESLKPTKVQKGGRKKKEEDILIPEIQIKSLSLEESTRLIKIALDKKAIEIKLNSKYYHYTDIIKGSLKDKLYLDMNFSALIKSVDDADRIINSNDLSTMIEKLKATAPSTFILIEEIQKDIINPEQYELIVNMNIKDLTADESKTLLTTAINKEALHIKIGKTYNRFYELSNISPAKLKRTVFEASIVEAPNGISSIDPDYSLFISNTNYKTILKTLKNTKKPHVIILSELCKL